MNGPLMKVYYEPLSLEAVKLHLLLQEVDRVVIEIKDIHNAIRNDADLHDAAVAEMRRLVSEMKALNADAREQNAIVLRSANSVLHSIAEKNLADSISKAVSLNVYAEVMPHFTEEIDVAMKKPIAEIGAVTKEFGATIADAVAGRPPLPQMPPEDAPYVEKATRRAIRCIARVQRAFISAIPTAVLLTCVLVAFTSLVVLHAEAHTLKFW